MTAMDKPVISAAGDNSDIARCFARCFRGDDGTRVLAHLRRATLDLATGPDLGDAQLRHLEGQRFTVRQIINLIERGQQ